LGEQPQGAPVPSASDGAARPANPWRALRRNGLRVEQGLQVFAPKAQIRFEAPAQLNNTMLHLYRGFQIGRYSYLRGGTVRHVESIGRYTSIGPHVLLGEAEHPIQWLSTSPAVFLAERYRFFPPEADAEDRVIVRTDQNTDPASRGLVTIGHDVWIGANVMVRRGITIGDGAIVASGAFVNRDVPPYAIVGGLPAKQIGARFEPDVVARLQELGWWEFDVADLAGVDFSDVHAAMDAIAAREAAGDARRIPLRYSTVTLHNDGFRGLKVNPEERARARARIERRRERLE
jgi:acetyltransferase-like isoleucine patch superfamily enzyme